MANVVFRKLSGWVGALACASLLAACGGGGGSPGTNPNKPDTGTGSPTVASVVVTPSATTLASSGQAGTEVTLTALVKDASNTAVSGATVKFTASSGAIGAVSGVSDSSGIVTAKLSTGGDASLRAIKVSASVGSISSAEITVNVVQATQTLTLTTDSGTLASSGAPGTEVNVTALVRDSNNSILPGVKVNLSVDSGTLTSSSNITDAQGKVTAKLSTGGDATSRVIKITGAIDNVAPVTANVSVVGSTVKVTTNPTVNVGASTDVSVKVADSAGNPLANKTVTFSSSFASNTLAVSGGGAAVTNSSGQLILTYKANAVPTTNGSDVITVNAVGEVGSASIAVSAITFTVTPAASVANVNTCVALAIHRDPPAAPATVGSVLVGSSRGTVYTDSACTVGNEQTVAQALDPVTGNTTLWVKATSPGIATLTANIINGGPITQGSMEFKAPLISSAIITVQADPAVVGANIAGSSTQQASIRAEVRDGTPANNLVKDAQVTFSIVSDASGGYLTQPAVVATGSDGAATVSFVPGTATTALNGVVIKAQLQGASTASATTTLTVSKKSLFISAGTGRDIGTAVSTTYTKDYAVLVTDASGNAVPGVNITASVLPRHYRKGTLVFPLPGGPWSMPLKQVGTDPVTLAPIYMEPYACPNEDLNKNGVIDSGEDVNHNGRLDPGIPVSVTTNVTTDASGRAIVTMTYPRDRALWLGVDLTIRGTVSGSEAVYIAYIPSLPGASADYSDGKASPPGLTSPYGSVNTFSAADCTNPN